MKSRGRLPRGYLIGQQLNTYNASRFGAISTTAEAEAVFSQLDGRLNALEFQSLFFDESDLRAHQAVARVGLAHEVDLWAGTFRLTDQIRAFGSIRPEFLAYVMEPDGRIVAADRNQAGDKTDAIFDVLNPEAMDWFLEGYRKKYFERMKGLLAGLFFDEDCVTYLGKAVDNHRFDYWRNATYSPRVLSLWGEYCRNQTVIHDGILVDKFPVHVPEMVDKGGGQTAYFPGCNVPAVINPGQQFTALPRAEGVWKHWYDFICGLFLKNWIGRLARMANEVNRNESLWKGVMYFGLHYWSLPYEEITNPQFCVPTIHPWGAWGRQRGVDLQKLAAHPEIDIIVCETYPPIAANLDEFVSEFARITREASKTFGVMLHRDDDWALKMDEEKQRWAMIDKYQPTVIARFPRQRMEAGDKFFNQEAENFFAKRLGQYRQERNRSLII